MKTLIGINNLTLVDQYVYSNHMQLAYRLGKNHPNDNFALCNPRRMSIDRMRNFCATAALEQEFDYVFFIDDDVLVPSTNVFKMLQEADKDIVAGVTLVRGYPFHPMLFDFSRSQEETHYVDNYMELADKETGLIKVDAVGFSCCLIKVSLLRKMTPPFFITADHHTEDIYFCQKAKRQFPDVTIYGHTGVLTQHLLGSEMVGPHNREALMTFEETLNPELKAFVAKSERRDARHDEYVDQNNIRPSQQEASVEVN